MQWMSTQLKQWLGLRRFATVVERKDTLHKTARERKWSEAWMWPNSLKQWQKRKNPRWRRTWILWKISEGQSQFRDTCKIYLWVDPAFWIYIYSIHHVWIERKRRINLEYIHQGQKRITKKQFNGMDAPTDVEIPKRKHQSIKKLRTPKPLQSGRQGIDRCNQWTKTRRCSLVFMANEKSQLGKNHWTQRS